MSEGNLFVLDENGIATEEIEHFSSWVFDVEAVAYKTWGQYIEYSLRYNVFNRPVWYRNGKKVKLKNEIELTKALEQQPINPFVDYSSGLWEGCWHVVIYKDEWRLVDPYLESVSNAPRLWEDKYQNDPQFVWETFQELFNYLPLEGIVYSRVRGNVNGLPVRNRVYVYRDWFRVDVENVLF